MPALWNPSSCSTGVYPAGPAGPVAPGDGTGVGRNYRTGVESKNYSTGACPMECVAYSIGVKPIQLGCTPLALLNIMIRIVWKVQQSSAVCQNYLKALRLI